MWEVFTVQRWKKDQWPVAFVKSVRDDLILPMFFMHQLNDGKEKYKEITIKPEK